MKILVTGGTGFLGKYLVKKILRNKVTIFSRKSGKKFRGVKFVSGDITSIGNLEKAFPADVVVHLAATLDEYEPDLFKINVGGTKNVVELCKKYNVKQLIHMSSTAAIGETRFATENSQRNPKSRYEKSKRDAEDVVTNSGLNYTIIRAPVIMGPSDVWLGILKLAKKKFPVIGKGNNCFHVAYVDDVAAIIVKSIGNKKAYGQVFHVATNDSPTYKEFYNMLCKSLGIEMTKKHIPVPLAKMASILHETTSKIRGKRPKFILARSNINRLVRDRKVSTKRAKSVLGFTPKYNTKRAIEETVNYFKKSGLI